MSASQNLSQSLLRQGFRQEILILMYLHSILVGILKEILKNLMTAVLMIMERKIMLISGGMDYGMIYLITINFLL